MDQRLMELLGGGGDSELRGLLQQLQTHIEENPDEAMAQVEAMARAGQTADPLRGPDVCVRPA